MNEDKKTDHQTQLRYIEIELDKIDSFIQGGMSAICSNEDNKLEVDFDFFDVINIKMTALLLEIHCFIEDNRNE